MSAIAQPSPLQAASHLVPLVPREWSVWRWFVLRGAGFPAALAQQLCNGDCGAFADKVLDSEAKANEAREAAIAAINAALDQASQARQTTAGQHRFQTLVGTLRSLRAKRPVSLSEDSFQEFFRHLQQAEQAAAGARDAFERQFPAVLERQSLTIARIAASPHFREALLWQNRTAFDTAVRELSNVPAAHGKKRRQHEQLVASYVQRYALKNDTIGFFGPVAWGEIAASGPAIEAAPQSPLISERVVSWETWAIDEVASALSEIEGMQAWIAPRLVPYARVDHRGVYLHGHLHHPLDPLSAETLRHCDGYLPARSIFDRVRQNPSLGSVTEDDVYNTLLQFAQLGILTWKFEVPLQPHADRALESLVAGIGDAELRATATAVLDRMKAAKASVRDAGGKPENLYSALQNIDSTFEQVTGTTARRSAGSMYAGRTIVYEDCRRNLQLRISPALLEPILPALSLLLASGRWFLASIAMAFESWLESAHGELAKTLNTPAVPAEAFWLKVQRLLLRGIPPAAQNVERDFERKWASMLIIPPDLHECRFSSSELADACATAFPVVNSTAFVPRYFCPDLMIAARDLPAVEQGDAVYVLGEMHLATNTLLSALFMEMHPERQAVAEGLRWDFPRGRLCLLNSRQWPRITTRTNITTFSDDDVLLAATSDATPPSGATAYPISSFLVEHSPRGLVFRSRDRRLSFPILQAFAEPLYGIVVNRARILANTEHAPRTLIDSLVIARESWIVPASELGFAWEREPHNRFLAMRRWAAARQMPPALFVKTDIEAKPVYVHLDSPVYIENVCKMIRAVDCATGAQSRVAFSEMLPSPDHLWLVDRDGNRYTSELRFTILDLHLRAMEDLSSTRGHA
jgi:hypothetical protein